MAIDLSYSPEVVDLVARTQAFIAEARRARRRKQFHGDITAAGGDDLRRELNAKAKAAGIFALHAPVEYGGLGLNMSDRSPVFTAAGHSTFGPVALHIGAPTRATSTCSPTSPATPSATSTSGRSRLARSATGSP